MTLLVSALLVGGFFLGSIPFGYLFARAKGIDLRKVGSGNIGATNVNRAIGSRMALLVFALDVLKALVPGLVARALITEPFLGAPPQVWWFACGAAALLGHMFCPWLGFKGGKGIASGLGAILAAAPLVAALCLTIFLAVTIPTRYVSLGSIVAGVCLPIINWFVPGQARELSVIYALFAAFIIWKHRENIGRILDGTESKFSFNRAQGDSVKPV